MVNQMWTGLAFQAEEITVMPPKVNLFGFQVSETLLYTWVVMLILIIAAVIIRLFVIPRFKTVPRGIQNVLEIVVSTCEKFTDSQLGKRGRVAAYMFTVALVIVSTSLIELFGFGRRRRISIHHRFVADVVCADQCVRLLLYRLLGPPEVVLKAQGFHAAHQRGDARGDTGIAVRSVFSATCLRAWW